MAIVRERLQGAFRKGDALAIYRAAKAEGGLLKFARQFLDDGDLQVQRKVLWSLCKADREEISALKAVQDKLIDLAMLTSDASVRRMSLSLVERMRIEADELRTDFLDFCLDRMVRLDEHSSIQALCMKLAFRMCRFYPELAGEFRRIVENMDLEYYSPAVHSVWRKVLRANWQ